QIGIAFHNYHGANDSFPPGFQSRSATVDGDSLGPGWGWGAYLLPYLEQGNLYSQIDFTKDITSAVNGPARLTPLAVFRCPADSPPGPTFTVKDVAGRPLCDVAFSN